MTTRPRLNLPPPFDEAMRLHERDIMRYLMRMTNNRDDALDLFQETWLRAYRAYPTLDCADGLRPWLYRIATNLTRNHWRGQGRRSRVIAESDPDQIDRASATDAGFARVQLNQLIAAMPHKQRGAFLMRRVGGFEYDEIGKALGCSAESARANLAVAMRKLKSAW